MAKKKPPGSIKERRVWGKHNLLKAARFPSIYHVENFVYDGFQVISPPGFAAWTVTNFQKWTNDAGIGLFMCSDGIIRPIPTCCLNPMYYHSLPEEPNLRPLEGVGVLFGTPSQSI